VAYPPRQQRAVQQLAQILLQMGLAVNKSYLGAKRATKWATVDSDMAVSASRGGCRSEYVKID
jgi:hypothetical protein